MLPACWSTRLATTNFLTRRRYENRGIEAKFVALEQRNPHLGRMRYPEEYPPNE